MTAAKSIVFGAAMAGLAWYAQILSAKGASLVLEDFSSGTNGWTEISEAGGITFEYDDQGDNLKGSFAALPFPWMETDGFQITSGEDFLGDYTGLTQIRFDFYAEDVLPSDLFIKLVSGLDMFSYQFSLGSMQVGTWATFTVNLLYDYGWQGPGGESAFNLALGAGGISSLQIEFTRSGQSAQSFYLDNVQTLDTPIVESIIPEPSLAMQMLVGGFLLYSMRRRIARQLALSIEA